MHAPHNTNNKNECIFISFLLTNCFMASNCLYVNRSRYPSCVRLIQIMLILCLYVFIWKIGTSQQMELSFESVNQKAIYLLTNTGSVRGENSKYTINDIHSLHAQFFLITIQYEKIKLLQNQAISTFFNLKISNCCKEWNT